MRVALAVKAAPLSPVDLARVLFDSVLPQDQPGDLFHLQRLRVSFPRMEYLVGPEVPDHALFFVYVLDHHDPPCHVHHPGPFQDRHLLPAAGVPDLLLVFYFSFVNLYCLPAVGAVPFSFRSVFHRPVLSSRECVIDPFREPVRPRRHLAHEVAYLLPASLLRRFPFFRAILHLRRRYGQKRVFLAPGRLYALTDPVFVLFGQIPSFRLNPLIRAAVKSEVRPVDLLRDPDRAFDLGLPPFLVLCEPGGKFEGGRVDHVSRVQFAVVPRVQDHQVVQFLERYLPAVSPRFRRL